MAPAPLPPAGAFAVDRRVLGPRWPPAWQAALAQAACASRAPPLGLWRRCGPSASERSRGGPIGAASLLQWRRRARPPPRAGQGKARGSAEEGGGGGSPPPGKEPAAATAAATPGCKVRGGPGGGSLTLAKGKAGGGHLCQGQPPSSTLGRGFWRTGGEMAVTCEAGSERMAAPPPFLPPHPSAPAAAPPSLPPSLPRLSWFAFPMRALCASSFNSASFPPPPAASASIACCI